MYQGEKRLCNSYFGICIFLKCPIYTVETTAEGGDRAQSRLLELHYCSAVNSWDSGSLSWVQDFLPAG